MLSSPQNESFDYIISGAGCAGMSLLLQMMQEPLLRNKTILIIDESTKEHNDKTWCFWENGTGFLEHLVHYKWKELSFHAEKSNLSLKLSPYAYKMIRSIDLYNYAKNVTLKRTKIVWLKASVQSLGNEEGKAFVVADNIKYTAEFVFNSVLINGQKKALEQDNCYKLLQHFKGWKIETKRPRFDENKATFMDFRVAQDMGTSFVYVLPTSPNCALVEYTFFNEQLLGKYEYDVLLKEYLQKEWGLTSYDYTITEEEYGIIPMTNHEFAGNNGNIIHIGTAGGWTKPSSGFTFQFIQKNCTILINQLVEGNAPIIRKSFFSKRFTWYDATLLNVLHNQKIEGRAVFQALFAKQKIQSLLRFLDNESSLWEELKILTSVPAYIFFPAAIHELFAIRKKVKQAQH